MYGKLVDDAIADLRGRSMVVDYYQGKNVLVTGGEGFVGCHVVQMLLALGALPILVKHKDYELTRQVDTKLLGHRVGAIDLIFHLAGSQMGIGRTSKNPGKSFYENLQMGMNVVELARDKGVKLVYAGSVCAYPEFPPVPFTEANLWAGVPEETNRPYGIAKRVVGEMLRAYHQQYGLKSAYLVLGNVYGPFDNFDTVTSHVIPALIRRFIDAKEAGATSVALWGTGQASRDFTYVTDTAKALILGGVTLDCPDPTNVGSGEEIRIAWLAKEIAKLVEYKGEIVWDYSKPEGAMRRLIRIDRAKKHLYWAPAVSLADGLLSTFEWYRGQHG